MASTLTSEEAKRRLRALRIVLPDVAERLVEVAVGLDRTRPPVEIVDGTAATDPLQVRLSSPGVELTRPSSSAIASTSSPISSRIDTLCRMGIPEANVDDYA
ncbi:MAG: hypothetical protein ABEL04_06315 [Salinibacter sp.]|uniref:hypothetical protein n=1 Tax=Salinibacter sp. TaxID=2065818 RepID=UPI0035D514D9